MFKLRRHDKTRVQKDLALTRQPSPLTEVENQAGDPSRVTTIEINQLLVLRKPDSLVARWCERCAAQGQWVTPEAAALLTNQDTRSIYRRVELGSVHFVETTEDGALVCLGSLFG